MLGLFWLFAFELLRKSSLSDLSLFSLASPSDTGSYTIYVGRQSLNGWNPYERSYRISQVVVPYGYTDPLFGQDIALVKLNSPVTFSDHIQPICVPNSDTQFPAGTLCTITGWGDIRDGGECREHWGQMKLVMNVRAIVSPEFWEARPIHGRRIHAGRFGGKRSEINTFFVQIMFYHQHFMHTLKCRFTSGFED